jgi:hypothetical protein
MTALGDLLRHCHGFRVETPRGRLGVVEDVLYGDGERPAALAVRGGLFGQRVELVPVENVASVEPRRKRLLLAAA